MKIRDSKRFYTGKIERRMDWSVTLTEYGEERELPSCTEIRNHSPTGFAWGYGGSGPAQTALAILVDAIGEKRALPLYQRFKWETITPLDQERGWTISYQEVLAWVRRQKFTREEQIVWGIENTK